MNAMKSTPQKFEIENDSENFEKLLTLVNFYNKTLEQYQKVFNVLESIPRHNGYILLDERCFDAIKETLLDYEVITAYTQKMIAKNSTVH